jgi:Domain of unknown function (DUF4136)
MRETRLSAWQAVVPAALLLGLAACYPASSIQGVQDLDTVTTAYNLDGGFTAYTTFSIPGFDGGYGTIPEITPDGGTSDTLTHTYDTLIMETVRTNFEAYGYMFVVPSADSTSQPSFEVFVSANATTYTYSYNYWAYYCAYYPYYYCGGGWYYYPYPVYSSYDLGTLLMDMEFPGEGQKFAWLWSGIIRGILTQGTVSQQQRLTADINAAFAQSPYLDKNGGQQ